MDGKNLLRLVEKIMNEPSHALSQILDERTTYDFFYEAAKHWAIETKCLTGIQEITTVASTAGYTLNGDFLELYLKHDDEFYVKLYDGTDYHFLTFKPYGDVYYENDTVAVAIPPHFTLLDDTTLDTLISDTADNAADDVGGKTVLTMTAAVFGDVSPGDIIHNTTDGSDGPVVKVTSTKIIEICLFGGTDNEIDANDAFIIQPRGRMKIQLVPPPSTKDYTLYVPYVQRPAPVYSDYDVYRIFLDYPDAAAQYVAWKYKYIDKEPNFGDAWYKYWQSGMTQYSALSARAMGKATSSIYPRIK